MTLISSRLTLTDYFTEWIIWKNQCKKKKKSSLCSHINSITYHICGDLCFLHKNLFLCSCDRYWWKVRARVSALRGRGLLCVSEVNAWLGSGIECVLTAGHLWRGQKKEQLPGSAAKLQGTRARSTLLCPFGVRATCWFPLLVCVCVHPSRSVPLPQAAASQVLL